MRVRLGAEELVLSWEEWEERVKSGRIPADALVRIDAITGEAFVPAGDLEAWRSLRDDDALAWRRELVAGGPPIVTALLLGVQIRIWWWQWLPPVEVAAFRNLLKVTPAILENGEVWRLLTMGFMHTELVHLGVNSLWLAYTGWNLERALGRANLALLFLASVAGGGLLSMWMAPWSPSLGSSGGVFGLIAASVVFGFTRPEMLPERSRSLFGWALLPYLLLMFLSGWSNERTDNWCHLGGLVTGGLLSLVLDPEPLQRRPGWNRIARGGVVAGILAVLAIPWALGPRALPIEDSKWAEYHALVQRGAETARPPEADPERTLTYDVPVGWVSGTGSSGDLGFGSPAGDRLWSVREEHGSAPLDPRQLADAWIGKVRRAFPEAQASELAPATVAGHDGWALAVDLPKATIEWRVMVRGTWAVAEVWEVEKAKASRLAPLRDRLRASVVWKEPGDVQRAREAAQLTPESRRARSRLADALAEVGEAGEALEIRRGLLQEAPEDENAWTGLLRLATWYPDRVPDREEIREKALQQHPTASVAVAVADSLYAEGRGDIGAGLLDLAWARTPGDRDLRKARRARGLSVELDAARGVPWDVANDPATGQPRPDEEIARRVARPLTLAEAEAAAKEASARRESATAMVTGGLEDGDWARATEGIVRLQHGRIPEDRERAVAAAAEHLKTIASGGRPAWLPEPARAAIADAITRDPALPSKLVLPPAAPGG